MSYIITGKRHTYSKKVQAISQFIIENFNKKGINLGMDNFNKKFCKWNEETKTVSSTSYPSVSDIKTACRLASETLRDSQSSVIVGYFDDPNTHEGPTVRTIPVSEFEKHYPAIKECKKAEKAEVSGDGEKPEISEVNPNEFLKDYINKHAENIDFEALKILIDAFAK